MSTRTPDVAEIDAILRMETSISPGEFGSEPALVAVGSPSSQFVLKMTVPVPTPGNDTSVVGSNKPYLQFSPSSNTNADGSLRRRTVKNSFMSYRKSLFAGLTRRSLLPQRNMSFLPDSQGDL